MWSKRGPRFVSRLHAHCAPGLCSGQFDLSPPRPGWRGQSGGGINKGPETGHLMAKLSQLGRNEWSPDTAQHTLWGKIVRLFGKVSFIKFQFHIMLIFISYRKNRWRKEEHFCPKSVFCWELKKLRVCTYHVMFGYNTAALCRVTSHAKTNESESSNWNKCNASENVKISTCTETDKHSNTNHWPNPTECTFYIKALGRFSGLFAGGQLLLAWILQYEAKSETRKQKRVGIRRKGWEIFDSSQNV